MNANLKVKVIFGEAGAFGPPNVAKLDQLAADLAGHQDRAALEHGASWFSVIITDYRDKHSAGFPTIEDRSEDEGFDEQDEPYALSAAETEPVPEVPAAPPAAPMLDVPAAPPSVARPAGWCSTSPWWAWLWT